MGTLLQNPFHWQSTQASKIATLFISQDESEIYFPNCHNLGDTTENILAKSVGSLQIKLSFLPVFLPPPPPPDLPSNKT